MKARYLHGAAALGLILLWMALLGCGESRSPFAGTYRSVEPFAGQGHIELVLKENGEATWTHAGNTLKFKWRVDDKRIWIYTKEGGILIVTPSNGGKILSADMSGEWHPGCPPEKCITFQRVEPGK
jgi:outer membrane lipoprotein-sorting protein